MATGQHRCADYRLSRRLEEALTGLLAPNRQVKLPGGVVDEAKDQHGAQDEQQLVCGLHGGQSFTWHHPGHYLQHGTGQKSHLSAGEGRAEADG